MAKIGNFWPEICFGTHQYPRNSCINWYIKLSQFKVYGPAERFDFVNKIHNIIDDNDIV